MTTPYTRPLADNLVMKSVRDHADAERLAAFNGQIFGEPVAGMTRRLIFDHPMSRLDYWLYIEDEQSQQIVSTLALIPHHWRYEDVTLKAGEMGIVATLDSYRNRGLVRALAARHRELLNEGDFDLSPIQGIPYFYRQFGYEYALPLEAGWHIENRDVPEVSPDELAAYSIRPATSADIPALMRFFDESTQPLDIAAVRSEALWHFLLEDSPGTATEGQVWMVLAGDGGPLGYFRIVFEGFGVGLIVGETSRFSHKAAPVVLHRLKTLAIERGKPGIRFNLPIDNDLLRTAQCFGAHDRGTYKWQIMLPDIPRLLTRIKPVLERRIAASPFAGLTQTACINLYREAYDLEFVAGQLRAVNAVGYRDGGSIRIPPMAFTPLLLGDRTREELAACYPDVSIWGQAAHLIDVLFPKMSGFIYTGY